MINIAQHMQYDWDAVIDNNGPAADAEIIKAIETILSRTLPDLTKP